VTAVGSREMSNLDVGHFALFYAGASQYRAGVAAFINEGLDHAEPVLVAVPADRQQVVQEALDARAQAVTFADLDAVGGNPARIIPAVWDFIDQHDHRQARVVGEPAWPARTIDEACEVCRHEALVNVAFAGRAATFLCPYDSVRLPAWVVANALATHPAVFAPGVRQLNDAYRGPVIPPACEAPLPAPPAAAEALTYVDDLRPVRALVGGQAGSAGLSDDRTADLIIAVSELAANTLQHAPGGGTVYVWHTGDQIFCQVYDLGQISDPLAGRRPPVPGSRGNGLWVVNQLCDLVEIRTGPGGTTIRVRMNLKPVKACLDGRQLR
jgi:anti-sigma regulatory factor (Ser/Thr protein kinase)